MPAATSTSIAVRSERTVIAFVAFLGVVFATGIDISLPAYDELSAAFGLDARGASPAIIGTAYFVGMAAGQLVYGMASDRFGRRNTLLVGLALYAVGAVIVALAPSLTVLLLGRVVWGAGAAAPSVLRIALARDLYDGEELARVITLGTAIFLIAPIFVPAIGAGLLSLFPWQVISVVGLVLAALGVVWTLRFGETLAADQRTPFDAGSLVAGLRSVVTSRWTLGHTLGSGFIGGAFLTFIGSAQPILDRVFDRNDQFPWFFGASAAVMAGSLFVSQRLIARFGARRIVASAASCFVVVAVVGCLLALATDGTPSVWLWFTWAVTGNLLATTINAVSPALAVEPMGDLAGTASAVFGFVSFGLGAGLAAIIDAQLDASITPTAIGSLVYGSIGAACFWWAGGDREMRARRVRHVVPMVTTSTV